MKTTTASPEQVLKKLVINSKNCNEGLFDLLSKHFDKRSGIYKISNITNGKIYIGSAVNIYHRINCHIRDLKKNENSKFLQRAWNKYQHEGFQFEVLEFCNEEDCIKREQHYLDTVLFAQEYISSNKSDKRFRRLGYNICPIAGSTKHFSHSEETKRKVSQTHKGRKQTKEHKEKVAFYSIGERNGMYGRNHDGESRLRMSINSSGEKNGMYGKTHSEEVRKNISEGHKKKVLAVNIYYGVFTEFNSVGEAATAFGCKNAALISKKLSDKKVFKNHLFIYN
jgi:group I intron endonuclease